MTDWRRSGARQRMADVSHTHPTDPRNVFGELFRRGATELADGGRDRAGSRGEGATTGSRGEGATDGSRDEEGRAVDAEEMEDVDHEAPDEEGATGVWERGSGPGGEPGTGDEDADDE